MKAIQQFTVIPKLPTPLEPLRELAYNLWWSWDPPTRKLFRHFNIDLWEKVNHSPLRMLQLTKQTRLLELAQDEDFLKELHAVYANFKDYMSRSGVYSQTRPQSPIKNPVAYFSAEFGFHESVPNYSGGLGILSGDHCKSASDLGLDFVAVTLLYRHGYFKQQINKDGVQEAVSLNQNFSALPITPVEQNGSPLLISVRLLDREVYAKVWRLRVGRINLYMLDSDIPNNTPEDRLITSELYGGDTETRIRQEILLGVGGVRALHAMGITPQVYHMNEGHSAFLSLERIRRNIQNKNIDFYSALQVVAASNVFTTHTPVPAGNDAFSSELMQAYFQDYIEEVGIDFDTFFQLGQKTVNKEPEFSMTILALRTSRHANGVSKLHGAVSRALWKDVWHGVPEKEVPITSITNGVHVKTWVAPEFAKLYTQYLGSDWHQKITEPDYWLRVIDIPDEELWETHMVLKNRLVEFIRKRIKATRSRVGESPEMVRRVNQLLNPEVLTIGFARRFATYKRATLLFSDMDRLLELVNNPDHPVQFIFAGKAHPKDEPGKQFIQQVYNFTRMPEFEGKIVFLEDYDHYIGRRLYQGVDLWLNNPLRPLEASGTSGMKLPPNGGLNFSVLDGWWCEGYNEKNGWPIGAEIDAGSRELQDEVDIHSLFHILENQIVPLYYAKPDGNLPVAWIQRMRESIRSVVPIFNTHRMVLEYCEKLYEPAAAARIELTVDNAGNAVALAKWKNQMRADWPGIDVHSVEIESLNGSATQVGETVSIRAGITLGPIDPEHVKVQLYFGETDEDTILTPAVSDMTERESTNSPGQFIYRGTIPATETGTIGFNVRVIPHHPHLTQKHELRLITWAENNV